MGQQLLTFLRSRWLIGLLTFYIAVALFLGVFIKPQIERFFLLQTGQQGESTLRLAFEGLQGALRHYAPLPALVAERPLLTTLLNSPDNEGLLPFVNEQLRQTAIRLDASDVYLMDMTGLTIAASSYRKDLSFIGSNFSYRPYFNQAIDGGLGQFAALGTTSGERGYFFASPVLDNTRIIGVIAIKISLERFEETWRGGSHDIIVSDVNDIVFLSNREEWLFRSLSPLSQTARAEIEATRQYPLDLISPLQQKLSPLEEQFSLIWLDVDGERTEFVTSSSRLYDSGWTVSVVTSTRAARVQALGLVSMIMLLVLFFGTVAAVYQQRRARLRERLNAQRATQELLEKRVIERTADLNATNAQLRQQVEERNSAEKQLRKAQAELIQAGKLAALGQMSAALSHEFNQPLAAVKSYSENAITFLDRGREADARENISRISMMADRMAAISRHLRNFARRPKEKVGPIPLVPVVQDAIALMMPRLKGAEARLDFTPPTYDIWVVGGRVRLQQVVVNLLTNALDAMEHLEHPRITISLKETVDGWQLRVRDYGKGISDDAFAIIFDPFVTTKKTGKGLGLGLSISYNIIKDFGGSLSAENHSNGGAVFIVDLTLAAPLKNKKA